MKIYKLFLLFILILSVRYSTALAQTGEYKIETNIAYYTEDIVQEDVYIKERCLLDIYYPKNINNFPTIVWFHGGGLTGGEKEIPFALKEKGFA